MEEPMSAQRIAIVGALLLGLGLAACQPAPTATPVEPGEVAPAETTEAEVPTECTFQVALMSPRTGDSAYWGLQTQYGATQGLEEINAAGGITEGPYAGCTYEIVGPFDDRGDPTEATNIAQQITTMDDVMAIIGPVNSSNMFAIMPIIDEAGIPMISGGASNPDLTKQGWSYFFRAFMNDGALARAAASFVHQQGYDRVVVAYSNSDYGRGIFENFQARGEELGMTILSADAWTPGQDREFTALVTKWQGLNPDAIFTAGEYTEAALITKQARLAGMEIPILGQGMYSEDFIQIAGPQGEGVLAFSLLDPFRQDALTTGFVQDFQARWGEAAAENAGFGYNAALVLNDAVSRMQGEGRDALRQALAETRDLPVVSYSVTFDETGEMVVPDTVPIVTLHDGVWISYSGQ